MNFAFWHPRFTVSLGINHGFCVLASQIRAVAENLSSILRAGTPDSCYRCESIVKSVLWHPVVVFSLRNYSEFYLASLLFSVGLGILFHRFDRGPNHDDFLKQLSQSAPKLVLVTLAGAFGSPFTSLRSCINILSLRIYKEFCVLAPLIRVFTLDSIMICAFER